MHPNNKKILIAAGGSGGHLLPAQQLAHELSKKTDILFAGHRLDASPFFQRELFQFQAIPSAPLKYSPIRLFQFFMATARGFWKSIRLIQTFRPDVVVGFGSFHSFPILLAALIMRRKIVLFEANCLLGKVNRFFAHHAKTVAVQFLVKTRLKNISFVPLLPWNDPPALLDKNQARLILNLKEDRLTCLIFGGSQGAAFLNRTIPECLSQEMQVIHLAGNEQAERELSERYRKLGIHAVVKTFESNMHLLYAAVDFVICRSGANSVAELIRYSLPSLLIPYPFASDDHQRINAEFLIKDVCGAVMLLENQANRQSIAQAIDQIINDSVNFRSSLLRYRHECEGRVSLSQQILQIGKIV